MCLNYIGFESRRSSDKHILVLPAFHKPTFRGPLSGSTITTFSIKKRWFIVKWINHLLPFNERHYIFNMTSDPYCPSKCNEKENEKHFLRYNNQDRLKMFEKLEKDIIIIFNKYKVDPDIRRVIRSMIKTREMNQSTSYIKNYIRTLSKQRKIRRDLILYGFMSKK